MNLTACIADSGVSGADKKNKLEEEVELCSVKLDRAQKLIGGLGGERARWSATADSLDAQYGALTGDALLGAATLSYLGAFTAQFRQRSVDVIAHAIRTPHAPVSAPPLPPQRLRLPRDALCACARSILPCDRHVCLLAGLCRWSCAANADQEAELWGAVCARLLLWRPPDRLA